MINVGIETSKTGQSKMIGAILLYGESSQYNTGVAAKFASIHSINWDTKQPIIAAGRPITEADLASLHKGLSESKSLPGSLWVDSKILAMGNGRMIWWTPPQQRPMFFDKSSNASQSFNGAGRCPNPGLVWMATSSALFIYAVAGNDRPTQETQLFQAPFFNVWSRGQVCVGSANMPDQDMKGEPGAWEKFFFGSRFTHANFTQENRLIKNQNPYSFWSKMVKEPTATFPENKLVKFPLKVGDLLDPLLSDRLKAIPKATGEF